VQKTNDVVWQKEEEESNSELNLSVCRGISAVKQHVVGALINSALRSNPLQNETAAVINKLQNTIHPVLLWLRLKLARSM